jgi:hypothetical protein
MKNLKLFFVATIATIAVLATSCSNNDDSTTTPTNSTNYKITVSASVTTNNCNTITAPYHVSTDFISENSIVQSYTHIGTNPSQIDENKVVSGRYIGVKLKLTDFNNNNQNSGRGIAVQYVNIKIFNNETGQLLLNKTNGETFQLYICTDTIYEATLLYDTVTNTYTITKGEWNF